MIKIALKHLVYEICIEQLFSMINKNFKPNISGWKVGDSFKQITLKQNEPIDHSMRIYHDAIIRHIDKEGFPEGNCTRFHVTVSSIDHVLPYCYEGYHFGKIYKGEWYYGYSFGGKHHGWGDYEYKIIKDGIVDYQKY